MLPNSSAFPACPKQAGEKVASAARTKKARCDLMSCKNINVTHARQMRRRQRPDYGDTHHGCAVRESTTVPIRTRVCTRRACYFGLNGHRESVSGSTAV